MSSHLPAACEELLRSLERATARLLDLNPADLSAVHTALSARAAAIESLVAWAAAREAPANADPEFALRLERSLTAGSAVALRLTLVRLGVTAELASLTREKCLLDAFAGTRASATFRAIDHTG